MAKKQEVREKKELKKVRSNFEAVGEVGAINDWAFNIDQNSPSGYKYSNMKLNIKVQDNNTISCEAMGGYFPSRASNVISVRSKDGDPIKVDWTDRTNEAILKEVSNMNKINIALERDVNNNLVYKEFLSWYDAIEYVQAHIEEGMKVKVRGNLSYSEYNDTVTVRKNIQSIFLATDKDKNHATFAQTILTMAEDLDKSHVKEDKIVDIHGKVVDYDKDFGTNRVFNQNFKYLIDTSDMERAGKILKYLTPSKKDVVREITVEGNLIEGANVSTVKKEDIPDELKDLIDLGLYTEEEILNKMAVKGPKSINFFVTKPMVSAAKEGEVPKIMKDDEKYTFDDLIVESVKKEENEVKESKDSEDDFDKMLSELDNEETSDDEEDPLAWMKTLEE